MSNNFTIERLEIEGKDGDLVLLVQTHVNYAIIGEYQGIVDNKSIKDPDEIKMLLKSYPIRIDPGRPQGRLIFPVVSNMSGNSIDISRKNFNAYIGPKEIIEAGLISRNWLEPYRHFCLSRMYQQIKEEEKKV